MRAAPYTTADQYCGQLVALSISSRLATTLGNTHTPCVTTFAMCSMVVGM
ncbi:hypothetical protein L798_09917 [Zootermopsis nevadensis]|uniref:Uncharacterized protein n=1 Tax=Zootermopsis nevadensis TaxID=136037 RepID=A0A067R3D9_ZOONE|nr:hypothetical protein L798_09917 [Zootermopsis nevadensis]